MRDIPKSWLRKNPENKMLSKLIETTLLNPVKILLKDPVMKRIWKIKIQKLSRESSTRIIKDNYKVTAI